MNEDTSVRYIDRSREYYAAHGYETPYEWAHFDSIPFAPLRKPLAECTVTIVTTAMPDSSYVKGNRRLSIGDLHDPPAALFTGDLAWDRDATHTDDPNTYFPVEELNRLVAARQLGRLAQQFYYLPTSYSKRRAIEADVPAIVNSCLTDEVDVALLVPL